MLKIRYGINQLQPRTKAHRRRRILHENHGMDFPQFTPEQWDDDTVQRAIRQAINRKHRTWAITGYCIDQRYHAQQVVATGRCPKCGYKLRQVTPDHWQCEWFGVAPSGTDTLPCTFECFLRGDHHAPVAWLNFFVQARRWVYRRASSFLAAAGCANYQARPPAAHRRGPGLHGAAVGGVACRITRLVLVTRPKGSTNE